MAGSIRTAEPSAPRRPTATILAKQTHLNWRIKKSQSNKMLVRETGLIWSQKLKCLRCLGWNQTSGAFSNPNLELKEVPFPNLNPNPLTLTI